MAPSKTDTSAKCTCNEQLPTVYLYIYILRRIFAYKKARFKIKHSQKSSMIGSLLLLQEKMVMADS